jgi:hypothetical protein
MITRFGIPALVCAASVALLATRWLAPSPAHAEAEHPSEPPVATGPVDPDTGLRGVNWSAGSGDAFIPRRERAMLEGAERREADELAQDSDVRTALERLDAAGNPVRTAFVRPGEDSPGLLAVE